MNGDSFEIDLERVANQPISEGIHLFAVASVEEGTSQNSGNPMWTFTMACQDPGDDAGKTIQLYLVLTQAARWKLEEFLDAVGAPQAGRVQAHQFVGKRLRCQISHEDYQGRAQARIGNMFPASGSLPASKAADKSTAVVVNRAPAPASQPAPQGAATKATSTKTAARKPALPADVLPSNEIPF